MQYSCIDMRNLWRPKSVAITYLNPKTTNNIQHNIKLNKCDNETATASSIDWGDKLMYPLLKLDYVIFSDCIYQKDIMPPLKKVVTGLLHTSRGSFLYMAPKCDRDGLPEFITAMKAEGFECKKEEVALEV